MYQIHKLMMRLVVLNTLINVAFLLSILFITNIALMFAICTLCIALSIVLWYKLIVLIRVSKILNRISKTQTYQILNTDSEFDLDVFRAIQAMERNRLRAKMSKKYHIPEEILMYDKILREQ